MVDDSATTNVIKDMPDGMIDALLDGVDIDAYKPVYITGDKKVKEVTAALSEANMKKLLGWSRGQGKTGYDKQVPVKTRFTVHQKGTAGETLAAGDPVKQESSTGAKVDYYKKFVEDTDGETQFLGLCWVGGADEAAIEILLF